MPTTDLTFPNNINVSVQIGDIIYYTPTSLIGVHDTAGAIVELGFVTAINGNTITVDYIAALPQPGDFIMFAKDRSTNMSSLLGYFAKIRFRNNSKEEAEIYAVAVDVSESSK